MGVGVASDPTRAALAAEVAAAQGAILELAETAPRVWWPPHVLRRQARNGWSAGAMGLALEELIAAGRFDVNAQLLVRLRK
jgi:hypothetical protein